MTLALPGAGCSGDDGPCDLLCQAQNLDKELAGEGKISLVERESDIDVLISAYREALSVCSGTQAREAEARIDDLEFEKELVNAIMTAFQTNEKAVETGVEFRPDVRGFQAALRRIYKEAEFYKPLAEWTLDSYDMADISSFTPDPALVSKEPSSNYTIWFLAAANGYPDNLPDWFREDVLESDIFEGYDLTHQFMCYQIQLLVWPDYDFGEWYSYRMSELAQRIADEQDAVPVDEPFYSIDLYAERIYNLLSGGYGDMVKVEWIERLLDDRLADGVWPRRLGDADPNWHATHLALLAIAEYQVILQRGEEGRKELFNASL